MYRRLCYTFAVIGEATEDSRGGFFGSRKRESDRAIIMRLQVFACSGEEAKGSSSLLSVGNFI